MAARGVVAASQYSLPLFPYFFDWSAEAVGSYYILIPLVCFSTFLVLWGLALLLLCTLPFSWVGGDLTVDTSGCGFLRWGMGNHELLLARGRGGGGLVLFACYFFLSWYG